MLVNQTIFLCLSWLKFSFFDFLLAEDVAHSEPDLRIPFRNILGKWKSIWMFFGFYDLYLDKRIQVKVEIHIILLIIDMVVERWNIWFGCETIHPTQKIISMNLLQMSCMITWAWSILTSEVVEAVRGQKHHISVHTLANSKFGSSHSASSAYQRFNKKWD